MRVERGVFQLFCEFVFMKPRQPLQTENIIQAHILEAHIQEPFKRIIKIKKPTVANYAFFTDITFTNINSITERYCHSNYIIKNIGSYQYR